MIRFVDHTLEPQFLDFAGKLGIFGVKIACQYCAYGNVSPSAQFWLSQDESGISNGIIAKIDGRITVAAGTAFDREEFASFLAALGGGILEGDERLIGTFAGGNTAPAAAGAVLKRLPLAGTGTARNAAAGRVQIPRKLEDVYMLLAQVNPAFDVPFDAWLTDVSHKTRHGLANIAVIYDGDKPASTAGFYFIHQASAILAGVATNPQSRGLGYASSLIAHLAALADGQGLTVYTQTASEAMLPFYQKFGFEIDTGWAHIRLGGDT